MLHRCAYKVEEIIVTLGFDGSCTMDIIWKSGQVACFWRLPSESHPINYSTNLINMEIRNHRGPSNHARRK